jgi:DNA-binding SARP family transcriptional activator/tetratricopeptide (TPR) repeat protein
VEFRILGPLEVADDTGPVQLTGGKQNALLALLLLHADRVVPVDRLVDDLWGEEVPASARKMLQIFVSRLRKQLPRGLIQTRSSGYRIDLGDHSLDLRTFAELHAEGREALANGREQHAAATLRRALGLWRGAPLAEFEEPFARMEEARLAEQHLTCLEECVDAELALGRHAELVAELDALARRHPLRERLRGQLMLALYRCGRHAEALEAFQSFRRKLRDELGIDPPARLKELERLMLQQDPSLDHSARDGAAEQEPESAAVPVPTRAPLGRVEFRILGPLEVRDGERVVPLGGVRRRAVLGLLLLEANRVVPVERLVDGVWGDDPPASAEASLQNHLFRLRRELGGRLVRRSPGYLLRVAPGELDLERFRRLVEEARGAESAVAAERLRDALALWRGPPLADLAAEPAGRAAAHLDELRLSALEDRIDADLALGRHVELVPELAELVVGDPYRERLRRQLIVALYRSGRQADALDAYADARRTLVEELGAEPGRELQEVHRAVLRQDPALDAPFVAAPPPSRPQLAESRRTVTVLVADVTPAEAPADPEARRAALLEQTRAAEQELDRRGASVASLGGGRVLGVFGVPAARDDDSLRAVTAAVALRSSAVARRVGLSTGEVVTGDPLVSGAPVDEAARLQERADAGDVLAADRTRRAVRHAVTASRRDDAWAIDAVDSDAAPLQRRLETPLVGRERELGEIAGAFERAAAEGRPHLVTVFGAPGVGKTRVAVELVERLRDLATSAVGRCRASARDATYAPLRDVLTELADDDAAAWVRERLATGGGQLAEQLAAAVGLGAGTAHGEDTSLAARRLLAGLARERPVLLVLEDVHWAAPAFLDLVESLVELTHAPVLVLCLARPDLLDVRPHWGGGRVSSSAILLDALTPAESEALLDRLCPDGGLDAAARRRILAVAEGNPLFIEQLLAAALEGDPDALPDSIQTLLAARLDRLDELDRAVVQAAAVCGSSFTTEDVATLVDGDVPASLVTLVRRELIRPGEAGDPGREGWSFRHSLIRDAAYGSVPKWRRAELHERLAARAAERGEDGDVSAGFHLDQAVRARRETGERGGAVDALAARAAEHLGRAGLAAFHRTDMAAAASLLGRANELLPHDAPERAEILLRLGEALGWVGERDASRALLAEAQAVADERDDARLAARTRLTTALTRVAAEDALPPEQMLRDIEEAVPVLERAGDHEGLAIAELARFHAFDRSRLPNPEERLSIALAHARRAGASAIEHIVMGWICITLPRGTVPVDKAIALVREIAESSSSAYVRASALGALGLLRAQIAQFEEARALVEETREALEELGLRQSAAAHSIAVGEVEVMAGDDAAAERVFRSGFDAVTALGDDHTATNVAWRLGLLLARQGRVDEAERFARVAENAPAPGLWVDVWWRVVLALVEAQRGAAARARALVAEAHALMAAVAESGMHADALLDSAEALRIAGHEDEAATLVTEAAGIAERLGYVVARRRADEARPARTT